MKTKEAFNEEYRRLIAKHEKEAWLGGVIVVSFVISVASYLCTNWTEKAFYATIPALALTVVLGFKLAWADEEMKELKRAWHLAGYGLKRYPH